MKSEDRISAMEKIMASARRTARILFVFIPDFPPIFSVLFRSDTRGRGQDRLHRSRQAAPSQLYYNIQQKNSKYSETSSFLVFYKQMYANSFGEIAKPSFLDFGVRNRYSK